MGLHRRASRARAAGLVVSLAHLQQQATDAAAQGDAAKRFRDLGIAIEDSNGNVRSGSELMMDAADDPASRPWHRGDGNGHAALR